ncbi:HYAS1 synthase, partial [Polyodon spathula]|nr:HYAS1 synthase [Polyodon spathula]
LSVLRRIFTVLFALAVAGAVLAAYIASYQIVWDSSKLFSFGLYGAFLIFHLVVQSFFAYLEQRKMRSQKLECSYTKTVALTISAYQEDSNYLRQCLLSVKNTKYPSDKLRVIMVIDGNSADDRYMMELFREVFSDDDVGCMVWQENYHTWKPWEPPGSGGEGGGLQLSTIEALGEINERCASVLPLGLYRNDLLQLFLESWYNQKFLGTHCTFGDDRHLTNRMLSIGYATKYTSRSRCYSETPSQFLRWLNQQIRWTKSYFREWLYNALWWHKHHLWMTYECMVAGVFPFFVTATVLELFYKGGLWDILWILLVIQIIGLGKALYACWLRGNPVMVFMSLYAVLYMTSLLPTKYFAILTMTKSSWGTSGRKKIVGNYMPLLPLSIWWCALLAGLGYTVYKDCQLDWTVPDTRREAVYLICGSAVYASYWILMVALYWFWIHRVCGK